MPSRKLVLGFPCGPRAPKRHRASVRPWRRHLDTILMHKIAPLLRHRKPPRASFGGAPESYGKPQNPLAPPAPPKKETFRAWEGRKESAPKRGKTFSVSVAPVALAWLVGYPVRGVGAVPATLGEWGEQPPARGTPAGFSAPGSPLPSPWPSWLPPCPSLAKKKPSRRRSPLEGKRRPFGLPHAGRIARTPRVRWVDNRATRGIP